MQIFAWRCGAFDGIPRRSAILICRQEHHLGQWWLGEDYGVKMPQYQVDRSDTSYSYPVPTQPKQATTFPK